MGGGIGLCDSASVSLDHVILKENRSTGGDGAMLGCYWMDSPVNVEIRNTLLCGYVQEGDCSYSTTQVSFEYAKRAVFENVEYRGNARELHEGAFTVTSDTIIVTNLRIFSVLSTQPTLFSALRYQEMSHVAIDSCGIDDHILTGDYLFWVSTWDGVLRLRNLTATHCSNTIDYAEGEVSGGGILRFSADTLLIDSLIATDNYSFSQHAVGRFYADAFGLLTNSLIMNNTAGNLSDCMCLGGGPIANFNGLSVENTRFLNNTSIASGYAEGEYGPYYIGGIILVAFGTPGASHIRNCDFIGNEVIDPDDYSLEGVGRAENQGSVLYVGYNYTEYGHISVEECRFLNNRLENVVPETPRDYMLAEESVGSSVSFRSENGSDYWTHFSMRNCLISGNDNGGVRVFMRGFFDMQNVEIVDNNRRGFFCLTDSLIVDNVLIQGTQVTALEWPQSCQFTGYMPSEQQALTLYIHEYCKLSNLSVIDNDLPFIFNTPWDGNTETLFSNCLISGNTYDCFVAPIIPGQNRDRIQFSYCMMQEAVNGSNNLIGDDPTWDAEYGVPYLSANSVGVDAGNPAAAFNDLEDPESPGMALWPSHGTVRNDIGYTGGPNVRDLDYLPLEPAVRTLPSSPTLGDAYPNPFNPITTIPFTIPQPGHFTLQAYNLRGQLVQTLADTDFPAGEHIARFDASHLASGLYIVRLSGPRCSEARKVLLVR